MKTIDTKDHIGWKKTLALSIILFISLVSGAVLTEHLIHEYKKLLVSSKVMTM